MDNLALKISKVIRKRVADRTHDPLDEWRGVFYGLPSKILNKVYDELARDGGIKAKLVNGNEIFVPVVLVTPTPPTSDPKIGESGVCSEYHLINLRNSPLCPKFVALIPPGARVNLSIDTTIDPFGLAEENIKSTSTIDQWWNDDFVQALISDAFDALEFTEEGFRDQASQLIRHAVSIADEVVANDFERSYAWNVLSRVYSIEKNTDLHNNINLACGFPRVGKGPFKANEQIDVLKNLGDHFEHLGMTNGFKELKKEGQNSQDELAIEDFSTHIRSVCDTSTSFAAAPSFYYGPCSAERLEAPPSWWKHLTLEKWIELLKDESRPEGAMLVECVNPLFAPTKGVPWVVQNRVDLLVSSSENINDVVNATITRKVAGAGNTVSWDCSIDKTYAHSEASLPSHRSPASYSVASPNSKTATIRVVSLESWASGFYIYTKDAKKITGPQLKGAIYECSFNLEGTGRHYFDIYTREGIKFEPIVELSYEDDDGSGTQANIIKVSECLWGFEAEISNGSSCIIKYTDNGGDEKKININFSCVDVESKGCNTEFERLVKLNRQEEGVNLSSSIDILKNRCSELQDRMLEADTIGSSCYPLVFSTDTSSVWRRPDWSTVNGSIISDKAFLHDPRPQIDEFHIPEDFLSSRKWIAEKIRGVDGNGLIESARLGEMLAKDDEFAEMLQKYLHSYYEWINNDEFIAPWVDVIAICGLETDGSTLKQEPYAVILNPLHPIRLAWQALAQKILYLSYKANHACPAASILDSHVSPDVLCLPIRAADGSVQPRTFLSLECGSDYWSVLWNDKSIDDLAEMSERSPFDKDFGLSIGGVTSGFSLSQVRRALDDVCSMLSAKPIISLMISSSSGQTNACNEGISDWSRKNLGDSPRGDRNSLGQRQIQVIDRRKKYSHPDDALISNLAEDTSNAVRWYQEFPPECSPDLGIIAQLDTISPRGSKSDINSPLAWGALLRHRVRRQLASGRGAFIRESRTSTARTTTGDSFADKLSLTIAALENLSDSRLGYEFAPSVTAIKDVLTKADFAAVSSAAVDPACFLGGWLPEGYLWDYDLPSYSRNAGDTNGYYLISKVKETDREALQSTLSAVLDGKILPASDIDSIITEVASRGIPTVRGLSGGASGASGDLGLFLASRLLQDGFRDQGEQTGLLPIVDKDGDVITLGLIVPVDPFRDYLEDLRKPLKQNHHLRPDLLVAGIRLSSTQCSIKLTPIEVKFRSEVLTPTESIGALSQAAALSELLLKLRELGNSQDLTLWRLAFQHFVVSMLSFSFRVYSQQKLVEEKSKEWTDIHAKVVEQIFSETVDLEIDPVGRLIVIDRTPVSGLKDIDGDGFQETIVLSPKDASCMLTEAEPKIYRQIKDKINHWNLLPKQLTGSQDSSEVRKPMPQTVVAAPDTNVQKEDIPEGNPAAVVVTGMPTSTEGDSTEIWAHEPTQIPDVGSSAGNEAPKTLPVSTHGVKIPMGETQDGFQHDMLYFNPSDTKLNQLNVGVVGDLGTGKTQLLKALVYRVATSGPDNRSISPRFLIFDYKNDYSDKNFVKAVNAKVVIPQHLPVNIFDISNSANTLTPWLDRFNFFSDILDKIYSGIGPVQRRNLKTAVRQAYESCELAGRQPTIYDVNDMYSTLLGDKVDSPSSILDDLVDREIFHPEPSKAESFDEFLNGVVVINLSILGQDDRAKNMVVAIMLNMFYEHMLRIPKREYLGKDPQLRALDSFLLVDEADNIMKYQFDVLKKVLLQGREFGVGVILASQYLRHFKAGATDYREPLLTWFIHKVPNITSSEIQSLGMDREVGQMVEQIKSLKMHHCLYKTEGVDGKIINAIPFYKLFNNES